MESNNNKELTAALTFDASYPTIGASGEMMPLQKNEQKALQANTSIVKQNNNTQEPKIESLQDLAKDIGRLAAIETSKNMEEMQYANPILMQDVYKTNTSTNPFSRAILGDYTARYEKYLPDADNETLNAKEQSGWSILGNSVLGGLFNASEAFAGAAASNGTMLRAAAAGDWSNIWNTEFTENQAKDLATASDYFAIYNDNTIKKSGISAYFGAGAGSKWGQLGQSFGFTVGTLGYVAAENVALAYLTGGLGNMAKSGSTIKKVYDAFKFLGKADKVVDGLTTLTTAEKLGRWGNAIRVANTTKNITVGEFSMEAAMYREEAIADQVAQYKSLYGVEPPKEKMAEIEAIVEKGGDTVALLNAAILIPSNLLQFGSFMKTGVFFGKPTTSALMKGTTREGIRLATKKGVATMAYNAAKGLGGVIPEGSEEALQSIASESAKHHYSIFNKDAAKSFFDVVKETAGEQAASGRLWDDFVAGAMIGGITSGFSALGSIGSGKKREQAVESYNQMNAENLPSAIASVGEERRYSSKGQDNITVSGMRLGNKALASMELTNNAFQSADARDNRDEKQFRDINDDGRKIIYYNATVNGLQDVQKDIFNESIDAIQNKEYAEMYMGKVDASDAEVIAHKQSKKEKFSQELDEFSDDWQKVDYKMGNPYSIKENPKEWQAWEEVKRDVVFYKQDFKNALNRSEQVNKSLETELKTFKDKTGANVSMADMNVLVSNVEREKELKRLLEEAKSLTATRDALDGTIHNEQKVEIRKKLKETNDRVDLISKLQNSAINALEFEYKGDEKGMQPYLKEYQKAADEWLRYLTDSKVGEDHPVMQLAVDAQILNSEADFFLTLYNTLLGNKEARQRYFNKYSVESRKIQRANAKKLKADEEAALENPPAPKTIEESFTPEETEEMKAKLGVENLEDVDKETILSVAESIPETPDNVDIKENLKDLAEGAFEAKKEEITPEEQKEVEVEKENKEIILEAIDEVNEDVLNNFTPSKELNIIYAGLKQKYGDKKATKLYDAAVRLVNPNQNTIVEIRIAGVVVKEANKYILKPFGNTDANSKKWTLYKDVDITDQFAELPTLESESISLQTEQESQGVALLNPALEYKKTNTIGGYEFTKTPSLEDGVEVKDISDLSKLIESEMYVHDKTDTKTGLTYSSSKNVLRKGVKYLGGGWYEVGTDNFGGTQLFNSVTKEAVELNHKKGGRSGIVIQDFLKNNSRYNDNIAVRGSKYTEAEHNPKFGGSGHYKGTYFYIGLNSESKALEHGENLSRVNISGANLYELGINGITFQTLKNEAKKAGYDTRDASGYPESEYLKNQGYDGIKRGNEVVLFEPEKFKTKEIPTKSEPLSDINNQEITTQANNNVVVLESEYVDNDIAKIIDAKKETILNNLISMNKLIKKCL